MATWLRYRSGEGIMADLLTAVMRSDGDGEEVGIATIIRKGNVPYPRPNSTGEELETRSSVASESAVMGSSDCSTWPFMDLNMPKSLARSPIS
jgi:hypothetical protein